jgi:hypothetical protein
MIILFCVKYIANNIFNTIHLTSIHYIFYIITVLFVTILTTNILINICKKFMPNNFLNWVGFI